MTATDHAFLKIYADRARPGGRSGRDVRPPAGRMFRVDAPVAVANDGPGDDTADATARTVPAPHMKLGSPAKETLQPMQLPTVFVLPTAHVTDGIAMAMTLVGSIHAASTIPSPHTDVNAFGCAETAAETSATLASHDGTTSLRADRRASTPAGAKPPSPQSSRPASPDRKGVLSEAETETAAAEQHNPWTPAWEVDRFHWPKVCTRLTASGARLVEIGERLKQANGDGLRVLGVTSALPSEGRTTVAICLARAAAIAGLRVVLIDADFGQPELASRLGLDTPCSWQDHVEQGLPLGECAIRSIEDQLTLLPLSGDDQERAEPEPARFQAILRDATAQFDLVLIDLGAVAATGRLLEATGPAAFDACILVRDLRRCGDPQLQNAARQLQSAGIASIGVVENFLAPPRAPTAFSDPPSTFIVH